MLTSSPKPRYTVEKSENLVRVTLPSKENTSRISSVIIWFFLWGCMVFALVYIAVAVNKYLHIVQKAATLGSYGDVSCFISVCFTFFFVIFLALGPFTIYRFLWLRVGKEVIEVTPQTLTITKQFAAWQISKKYESEKVMNLRPNTQPMSTIIFPRTTIGKFLASVGMIAFDYETNTFSFGQDIDEVEAKQMILVIQEMLPLYRAG